MDQDKQRTLERIMARRHESWCKLPEVGWAVVDFSEAVASGGNRLVHLAETGQTICMNEREWSEAEARSNWKTICRSQSVANTFSEVFRRWRDFRDAEMRLQTQQEQSYREALIALMDAIPRYSLANRHRVHVQASGVKYHGVRTPEENERNRRHRRAKCWNCARRLDNYQEFEFKTCNWILCKCGACGCGQLRQILTCPTCGSKFQIRSGNHPFCGSKCRVAALKEYDQYLQSDQWKMRRRGRLEYDGHKCQDCGGGASHVHHLTYEHVGHESIEEIVSLCHNCHSIRHGMALLPEIAAEVMKSLTEVL